MIKYLNSKNLTIICFLLLVLLAFFVYCNNVDINERERKFYNMAFDSLFNKYLDLSTWASFPNQDNIDSIFICLVLVTIDLESLDVRLAKIPRKMARSVDEYNRIANSYIYAKRVLYGAFEFYVYQYWAEYFKIDSTLRYYDKIGYLSLLQKVKMDSLRMERKRLETITIDRLLNLDGYLYNKKDSLRLLGWRNFIEEKKYQYN